MRKKIVLLLLILASACSTDGSEKDWFYAIYVRDTCETTTNTEYSDYYCVSKETYDRAVEIENGSGCAEISFVTLSGETVEGVVSGFAKSVYEVECD